MRGSDRSRLWRSAGLAALLAGGLLQSGRAQESEWVLIQRAHYVMGSIFEIRAYGDDGNRVARGVEEAFAAIRHGDQVMSHYREESDLMRLNRLGGEQAVSVPAELYAVLQESVRYGQLSGGVFDVTIGPVVRLWQHAAEVDRLPDQEEIALARVRVGYDKIHFLSGSRVRLAQPGMEVNLGGIGKGWAVDHAAEILRRHGIENALISAGASTLYALGSPPGRSGWQVAIRNPCEPEGTIHTLALREQAVSTSASYERYWTIEGTRYSHIIDPRTGRPTEPVASTSVLAPTATEADALSTTIYVMGKDEGAELLRRLGRQGLWVRRQGDVCSFVAMEKSLVVPSQQVKSHGGN